MAQWLLISNRQFSLAVPWGQRPLATSTGQALPKDLSPCNLSNVETPSQLCVLYQPGDDLKQTKVGWKPPSRPRPTWRWRSSSQPELPSSYFPSAGGAVTPKAGAGSSSCPPLPQPPAKQPASSLHCQGPTLVVKGGSKAAHICCCSH